MSAAGADGSSQGIRAWPVGVRNVFGLGAAMRLCCAIAGMSTDFAQSDSIAPMVRDRTSTGLGTFSSMDQSRSLSTETFSGDPGWV